MPQIVLQSNNYCTAYTGLAGQSIEIMDEVFVTSDEVVKDPYVCVCGRPKVLHFKSCHVLAIASDRPQFFSAT